MSFVCCKSPVAAKRHWCYLCNQWIEVGERHEYRSGVTDGDFWSMRMHPECAHEVDSDRDFEWEDFEPGSLERPMTAFDPCI
jgi:hypothetical protein